MLQYPNYHFVLMLHTTFAEPRITSGKADGDDDPDWADSAGNVDQDRDYDEGEGLKEGDILGVEGVGRCPPPPPWKVLGTSTFFIELY